MGELTSKAKLKFSLVGIGFMLAVLKMPRSPFEEITQVDWVIWAIIMGALLGAATRSFILVAYQWSYQRDRKKRK
jgi:hypothetical protein|tara:strand:+ start:504 stop:728 length:225 start_codon:yes stop_codon:yes gene_type:complete